MHSTCTVHVFHPCLLLCVLSDSVTGELKISNHSQSAAGIYLCEVNNAVGAERCRINLKANKRKGMHHSHAPCLSTFICTRHAHVIMKDLDFSILSSRPSL